MYNDLFDIGPDNKEMAFGILIVFAVLVVIFFAGYCVGISTSAGTENVHDNGNTTAGVGNAIESAGSNIGAAKSGIDNAAAAAGRIEERIADAQERAEYVKGTADEGRRIIAECQSILREVRAGGQKGKAAN